MGRIAWVLALACVLAPPARAGALAIYRNANDGRNEAVATTCARSTSLELLRQLRLAPHPLLTLNLLVHEFRLLEADDSRYAGSGAFDESAFGLPATTSGGHRNVGTEYHVVATFTPHAAVTVEAGFAWLDGGAVCRVAVERDVQLGYVSMELRYERCYWTDWM